MMIRVNALGDACPLPVVKAKNAVKELQGSGCVEVLVDNEIAVQNLMKMAQQKGYQVKSEKLGADKFQVILLVGDAEKEDITEAAACFPDARRSKVIVISSERMGSGDDVLGALLMKGFIFALTQQDELPATILLYNSGAHLTCEGSAALEDFRTLEAQGVEILTCGTCLNHYGIQDKLQVGSVTNMYVIAEKMLQAGAVIKP